VRLQSFLRLVDARLDGPREAKKHLSSLFLSSIQPAG
jgi:hypothetical protein